MTLQRIACLLLVAWVQPASAQPLVALVEDIKGQVAGLEIMDYVATGRTFELAPDDTVVVDYLSSCIRETIHGGVVKIGVEKSEVASGTIERAKVNCDAGKMMATSGQQVDNAGYIFRSWRATNERALSVARAAPPQFTLYGSSPLVELNGSGRLIVARLDKKGEYFDLMIDQEKLSRRRFLDFAASSMSLTAGGVYGARWDNRLVVFRIDPTASSGHSPIIGRLLRLGFAPESR